MEFLDEALFKDFFAINKLFICENLAQLSELGHSYHTLFNRQLFIIEKY